MGFIPHQVPDITIRTQQHFKQDCDINHVVNRYFKTGILKTVDGNPKNMPKFGDFSRTLDYAQALNTIQTANDQFKNLGSAVRKRFKNNPANFIAFMENPENLDEAIKLGLAEKVKTTAPTVEIGEDGKIITSTSAT